MTFDNHCCKQTLPMIGILPISCDDEAPASLTFFPILGLPFMSIHQFEGDILY